MTHISKTYNAVILRALTTGFEFSSNHGFFYHSWITPNHLILMVDSRAFHLTVDAIGSLERDAIHENGSHAFPSTYR